jgi:hypothetical protein
MPILRLRSEPFLTCGSWAPPSLSGSLRTLRYRMGVVFTVVLTVAALTIEADAQGRGGGKGGGGGGFGHGGSGIGIRSFGSPRAGGGIGVRSFGGAALNRGRGMHSFSKPRIGNAGTTLRSFGGNRRSGLAAGHSGANVQRVPRGGSAQGFVTARSVSAPGAFSRKITRGQEVLGKRYITNTAWRGSMAPVWYHGRFYGSPWPWWYGGIVIGWIGPVFWPYVYDDFFDYVFWPYVYDDFWLYAYDDVYYGIYGPYAYVDPRSRNIAHRARAGAALQAQASICSGHGAELTDWPIERIAETVQPTEAQRAALEELKAASANAVTTMTEACPTELPTIPTGRLAAMENRLEVMIAAVRTVRPALQNLYQSLDDEQKARFNAIAPARQTTAVARDQRDLSRLCDERSPGVTDLPIDRVAQAVQPTEPQSAALDQLKEASLRAAGTLRASCVPYHALTPVGRVEAMEQRLETTLGAVRTVKPALASFYDLLSDEQKARFNALRSSTTRARADASR